MEFLPARLSIHRNHNAGVTSILGVEGGGLHLKLADRVQGDLRILAVIGTNVGIDRPVQKDIVIRAAQAVHVEGVGVVEGEAEIRTVVRNYTRQGAHQGLEVAPVQRQVRDLLVGQREALVGRRGFDERHLGFYRNRVGDGTNFQGHIPQVHILVLVKLERRAGAGLKARHLNLEVIETGLDVGHLEAAIGAGSYFARNHIFPLIGGGNFGTFDRGAGRVNKDALNGAGLRKERDGTKYHYAHKRSDHDAKPITNAMW